MTTSDSIPATATRTGATSLTHETSAVALLDADSGAAGFAQQRASGAGSANPASPAAEPCALLDHGTQESRAGQPVVARGLTQSVSTSALRGSSRLLALAMLNRFRVMRTIDVAVVCAPERGFKAALSAAQRVVRGLVKDGMVRRYKTHQHQTVYGLTRRGADLLLENGIEAESSVRRVSDMTNPEHRLWLQFIALAAEARGLSAETEQELLRRLNKGREVTKAAISGLVQVVVRVGQTDSPRLLRPDAVIHETDGTTWVEIDKSKRGADREAALRALALSVGSNLVDGTVLRRVVILCKTDRIQSRALAVLRGLAREMNDKELVNGRRHIQESLPGTFKVRASVTYNAGGRRQGQRQDDVGHVVVQMLPVWLPRVRVDSKNRHSLDGWLDQDYLPYRRAAVGAPWSSASTPLAVPVSGARRT